MRFLGKNKGCEVVVLWVGEATGEPAIRVKYCNTGVEVDCRPWNFVSLEDWRTASYIPRATVIEKAKQWLMADQRIIEMKSKKCVIILYDWGTPNKIVLRRLIEDGFIKKAGRLGVVLKSHDSSWGNYRDRRKEAGKARFNPNATIYEILGDVSKFSW